MYLLIKKNRYPDFEASQNIGIYSTLEKALDKVAFKVEDGRIFQHQGKFVSWSCPETKYVMKGIRRHVDVYVSYEVQYFEVDK